MDVGSFAASPPAPDDDFPSPYSEPSTDEPWNIVAALCEGQDLDVLGKGKGGSKDYAKKPLDCHNCGETGHPMRLCTSAVGQIHRWQRLRELHGHWAHELELPQPTRC